MRQAIFLLFEALAWIASFGVMLSGALIVGPPIVHEVRLRWRLFARVLFAVWILVPFLNITIMLTLGVTGTAATILLLMSVCPGLPLLLSATRSARGSMRTALLALVLTTMTEPFLMPLWTRFISRFSPLDLGITMEEVLFVLVPTVFLPIALGFFLRAAWPKVVPRLIKIADVLYIVGTAACTVIMISQGALVLPRVPIEAVVATLLITLADFVIGAWAGSPHSDDRKALGFAAALSNPALALVVVQSVYPSYRASVFVSIFLLLRAVVLVPIEVLLWLRARQREKMAQERVASELLPHSSRRS